MLGPPATNQLALGVRIEVVARAPQAYSRQQRPIVLMHGLGDSSHNDGFASLCESARRFTGAHVVCAAVADGWDSVTMSLAEQVDRLASVVVADPQLAGGFHAVGFSQGALVVRGYIERHNAPRVCRFVSVVGPHEGVGACPLTAYPWLCQMWLVAPYSAPVSFSGYWKDVSDRDKYLASSTWLADANNERRVNVAYRANLMRLERLVLVRALNDSTVVPSASEQFGFWPWGEADGTPTPMRQTDGYVSDALGLRSLDEAGRLREEAYEGEHMRFAQEFWTATILPHLRDADEE